MQAVFDSTGIVRRYAESLSEEPLLTTSQEVELSDRYHDSGDQSALDELIRCNVRLVITIARHMCGGASVPMDDAVQAGCLGLSIGARRFRSGMGAKFSTYVATWIKNEIRKCMRLRRTVRIPAWCSENYRSAMRCVADFTQEHGRKPTASELRGMLPSSVSYPTISRALYKGISSLDEDVFQDSNKSYLGAISDRSVSDSSSTEEDYQEMFSGMGKCLCDKERTVLVRRFGLDGREPLSTEEVAREVGCTKQNVCCIQKKALRKLRAYLERDMAAGQ